MSGALVAVNGTRLHCERAGEGSPLVMIHGDALGARLWDGQFAFFAREREVLRYDVRGFGRSDPPGALVLLDSGLGGYPWSVEVREFFAAIFAVARDRMSRRRLRCGRKRRDRITCFGPLRLRPSGCL